MENTPIENASEISKDDKILSIISDNFKSKNEDIEKYKMEIESLKTQNNEKEIIIGQLERSCEELKNEKETESVQHKEEINALTTKMKAKDDENKRLIEFYETERDKAIALQERIHSLENDKQALVNERNALELRTQTHHGLTSDEDLGEEESRSTQGADEAEAETLIYEGETIRNERISELVKTKEEIAALDPEGIRKLLSSEAKYVEARDELRAHRFNLKKLLIKVEHGHVKLSKDLEKKLNEEFCSCEEESQEIKCTLQDLKESAKSRNIRVNTDWRGRENNIYHEVPNFDGNNGELDVYQFEISCKDYLRFYSIADDVAGEQIKSWISGHPKQVIDSHFKLIVSPNIEELFLLLKEHFGNKKSILEDIIKSHEAIGRIAHTEMYLKLSEEDLEKTYDQVQEHIKLFERVKLMKEDENKDNKCSTYRKMDISKYRSVILRILPPSKVRKFVKETRKENVDVIMSVMKGFLYDIHEFLFDIIQEGLAELNTEERILEVNMQTENCNMVLEHGTKYMTRGSESKTKTETNKTNGSRINIYRKNLEVSDCSLCSYMKTVFDIDPKHREHGMSAKNNGNHEVIQISCPHISYLSMEEKDRFLGNYGFCRSCIKEPVNEKHKEKKCPFGRQYKTRCSGEPRCNKYYLVCHDHRQLHEKKIIRKQNALMEAGIYCNF